MASFVAAIVMAVVFILLGTYLVVGPYASDRSYNPSPGEPEDWGLVSWFYFVLPVEVQVSWSGLSPSPDVAVYGCSQASGSTCQVPGALVASGNGSSGTFTFSAAEGQLYVISSSSSTIITVSSTFSSIYGAIVFIIFVAGVVCLATGLMRYSIRDRYSAI